jgi:hypothetical protein
MIEALYLLRQQYNNKMRLLSYEFWIAIIVNMASKYFLSSVTAHKSVPYSS